MALVAAAPAVAAQIVASLGITGPAQAAATVFWTAIVSEIFTGIAASATVVGTATGVTAGASAVPVAGTVT